MAHIKREHMQIIDSIDSYEAAITHAAQPLVDDGLITHEYIDQMLQSIEEHGTYIVLTDYFALPHARPSDAVKENALSLLVVREGVDLIGNDIRLFIVLAAKDSTTHMETLQSLAEFLMNKQNIYDVIEAKDTKTIEQILEERW